MHMNYRDIPVQCIHSQTLSSFINANILSVFIILKLGHLPLVLAYLILQSDLYAWGGGGYMVPYPTQHRNCAVNTEVSLSHTSTSSFTGRAVQRVIGDCVADYYWWKQGIFITALHHCALPTCVCTALHSGFLFKGDVRPKNAVTFSTKKNYLSTVDEDTLIPYKQSK